MTHYIWLLVINSTTVFQYGICYQRTEHSCPAIANTCPLAAILGDNLHDDSIINNSISIFTKSTIMRRFISKLILLLANDTLYSQPIIVKNDAVQVLYRGAENPITVHVDKYKPSQLKVKVSTGEISKVNNFGSYNWKICNCKEDLVSINIYCNSQFIKSIKFAVKSLPNPSMLCHNCCEGGCDFMRVKGIEYGFEEGDYLIPKVKCKVLSYSFSLVKKDTTLSVLNIGSVFSIDVKRLLEIGEPNDVIIIQDIKVVMGCDSMVRTIQPYVRRLY